jgi:hypothetical protein
MPKEPIIRAGIYKHYKGGLYKVIGIAKDSESNEQLVVYRSAEDGRQLWVRPLDMFRDKVKVDGKSLPRFEYTGLE